ncbi:MAG TPA: methyltransferase domain-containing protein [Acidobacteriaceae bacterium]|jgi:SAM-dependent methyltransferase
MSQLQARRPYQGVLQIVHFNSRKYLAAGVCTLAAALVWPLLPALGRAALLLAVAPALFWTAMSLLVSHYVYDRYPLYDFRPIARLLTQAPRRWVNIHSGWDETSERLGDVFPAASGQVVDIFDARLMTESSIHQARRVQHNAMPATRGCYYALPFEAESFDAAFSIFAAHELRQHEQRVLLFREIARVLDPSGEFVLMEHLRDWRNFLAFGPGFLHFFSQRAWRNAASEAGLTLETELGMTPFVHVYVLRRNV